MNQYQLIEKYADRAETERGHKAATRLRKALKRWHKFIGTETITPAKLDEFITWLCSCDLKPTTCNWIQATVKAFLRWQRRIGEDTGLTNDDLTEWKRLKVQRPVPTVWKPAVINTLLRTAATTTHRSRQRWRVYLLLGLGLGARPGETFQIAAKDVDLDRQEVTIWGTKTGVQRRVPYFESPNLVKLMPFLCEAVPSGPFVKEFNRHSFHRLCELALTERYARKDVRSTADAYIASGSKMPEYLIASRFGHSTEVAMEAYREPIYSVTGTTIEEWMSAQEGFEICTRAAMNYPYRAPTIVTDTQ